MSNVHIYRAPYQPATGYRIDVLSGKTHWVRHKSRTPMFTDCCLSWRWAKYVHVQVYYDGVRRWCRPGHGCNA